MYVIKNYAPRNDKSKLVKEEFYGKLQNIINNLGNGIIKKENVCSLSDERGSDYTDYEEIERKHGLSITNENGKLFINVCAGNQYVIG